MVPIARCALHMGSLDMREACGCGWVKGAALSTAILCCQGRCGKADLAAGMNVESRGKKQAARRSLTDWCKAGPFVVLDRNAAPPLRVGVSGEVAVSRREAGAQTRWVRSSEQNTTHNTRHHTHLLQRDRPVCIYFGCRGAVPCRVVATARLLCASGCYSWNTMAAYPPRTRATRPLIVLTAGFV